MKRLLLSLSGVMLLSGIITAQNAPVLGYNKEFKKTQTGDEQVFYQDEMTQRLSNYDDTIWFDSFDDENIWLINNQNANGWDISQTTQTWYFQNTSINSTTGGNYAVLVPDNPDGSQSATLHTITTAAPIDISMYAGQNLVLHYEKYGARFLDTLKVQVSNDGTTWTTLDLNVYFPILTTAGGSVTENPASRDLFIPASIVNGNDLFIRFRWEADHATQPAIGYGWFIDDIAVFDVPANDLVIDQTAFFDDVRLLYSWYYGAMPERQAETDEITFSATYVNRGSANATNTALELTVSGQESQVFTSTTQNLAAGATADTARTTTVYAPSAGEGTYTFTWEIISDSTDEIQANNMVSLDMLVTENEFSMAPLPISAANIVGKGGSANPYVITQDYFFNTEDTITSIGAAFDSEWTNVGASFQLSLQDSEGQIVTQSDIFLVEQWMVTDDMVYFPVPEVVIPQGAYEARFEVFSDSLFLVTCQDPIPPIEPAPGGGFFSRTTLSFGGNNFIEDMVYLTLRTKIAPICNPNAQVSAFVNDTGEVGSIQILDVTGLTCCLYDYAWTGPDGFTDNEADIDDLTVKGEYTVVVTDVEGCTASETFDVQGSVSSEDFFTSSNVSIFPNPTAGNFNLKFDDAKGEYNVNIINTLGQVVANRNITVNGNAQVIEFSDLNMNKGVYTLTIKNLDNNTNINHKVVVK